MNPLDNTFHFVRFKNLCRLIVANRWKRDLLGGLLLFILVAVCSYAIFSFIVMASSSIDGASLSAAVLVSKDAQGLWMFILSIIGGSYCISFISDLSPKQPRASVFLMLPVSSFERITSIALIASLAYTLFAAFLIMLGINVGVLIAGINITHFKYTFLPLFLDSSFGKLLFYVLQVQAVFLVGTFYFRKSVFVKTILLLLLIMVIYLLFDSLMLALFVKIAGVETRSFGELFFIASSLGQRAKSMTDYAFPDLTAIFQCLFLLFMWTFAFIKIKEKQTK